MTDSRSALQALLDHYLEMVNSGDCGFWDPERESVVKDARAALAAPTAKGGTEVPAGWKLVPVEPTAEMIEAARRWGLGNHAASEAYAVMIAASPPPPAGAAGGGSGDLGLWAARLRSGIAMAENSGVSRIEAAGNLDTWRAVLARIEAPAPPSSVKTIRL